MPLSAVLFDLGDTLVKLDPFPSELAGPLRAALQTEGFIDADRRAEEIVSLVSAATHAASAEGQEAEVRIASLVAEALECRDAEVCSRLGDVWGAADVGRIREVPGREALLTALSDRGLKLGIVSNTTTRAQLLTTMLDGFGLSSHFEAIVYSSEIGTRKPHAPIYVAALNSLGVAADETLFVGDRLREDVLGPSRLGMRAVLTHEFFRDPHKGEPFAVIDRLEDILALIDGLP